MIDIQEMTVLLVDDVVLTCKLIGKLDCLKTTLLDFGCSLQRNSIGE